MLWDIFNIYVFIEAIWIILPAYAANGLTPLVSRRKRNHPIDRGRKFLGQPLFGKGKTWEGLFLGVLVALIISLVELLAFPFLPWDISPIPLQIIPMSFGLGFLLGLGAMLGDIGGSFVKRRLKMKRGAFAPILDQDDFVVGALLFTSILITIEIKWWIMLLVITPIFHLIANIIGYLLKLKKQPY